MATKMTHPEGVGEIEVRSDQVPLYESQGWETSSKTKPTEGDK